MKIKKSIYVCQTCGYESTGWLGKCPECDTWGSLVEVVNSKNTTSAKRNSHSGTVMPTQKLNDIKTNKTDRISTKISELDRVLGGGIVKGQVILIAGEPGVGKSTILLQLTDILGNVVYASGEESAHQVAIRAKRIGAVSKTTQILEDTNIDNIISSLHSVLHAQKLQAVIIDSIQTMSTNDLTGMAGSVGQIRECAYRLVRFAKETGVPVVIVGHITKQGSVAGPSLLMHIVDTVLWFEGTNDLMFRMLRARKNRFGPTDEVGIFTMEEKGLISVEDTSELFVSDVKDAVSGSVRAVVMEGTRPIVVEVQSLLVKSKLAFSKRVVQGVDSKRLELLLAVLERRCGLNVSDYDVFINIVGGIKIRETGSDLAICLSVASSYFDKKLPVHLIATGEVGLLGEIRKVTSEDKRIKEAKRLGYTTVISGKNYKYVRDVIADTLPKKQ